jgi:hypothetical protein
MDCYQDVVRLVVDQVWHQQLDLLALRELQCLELLKLVLELELHLQVLPLQLACLLQLALRQLEPPLFWLGLSWLELALLLLLLLIQETCRVDDE